MDRNTVMRWLLIAAAIILFWKCGKPLLFGESSSGVQPVPTETYVNAPDFAPDPIVDAVDPNQATVPLEDTRCPIVGNRFHAEASTRGAALTHFILDDTSYGGGVQLDLVSSPNRDDSAILGAGWDVGGYRDVERWRPLRTLFRTDGANDQLKYDRFVWHLQQLPNGCKFTYTDADVSIEKSILAGTRPYELDVETKVTNVAETPRTHRLSIGGTAFRLNKEVKGHLGRVSPFVTEITCASSNGVTRKGREDFKKGWMSENVDRFGAVTNYYFAQALVPQNASARCDALAEDWNAAGQDRDADTAGTVYHVQLSYEPKTLKSGESATYTQTSFMGPKEREILKAARGPNKNLGDLINLGFFSPVAKILVGFLVWLKTNITHNWGIAIILLTLCVRLLLFPLTWQQIKAGLSMRKLKPDIDDINKRFGDDMQTKQLHMMELYKKHGMGPLGPGAKGCLPALVQMPVWFAMYTSLQTAVEMYHTPFLWFKDLSAPDQLFSVHAFGDIYSIGPLPLLLGAFMILQQRIVPQQGMDPMQQKMMTYILPSVFTVMMLFLPAALGVYMLTNSVLSITQQLVMERIHPRDPTPKQIEVSVKPDDDDGGGKNERAALRKGKARV